MAFFIPRSFQKRVIRYALAHIDLLDVDALDLDRLDIGWRSENTISLNDVALHKHKLALLLNLPDEFTVQDASTSSLSLSIPVDLQSKPIKIRLTGIRVRILQSSPVQSQPPSKRKHGDAGARQSDNTNGVLPSPKDLAQSYLDHETPEKKAELAAEVTSPDMSQSIASSDTEEDLAGFGNTVGLGLPSFLASFLRSVAQRVLVSLQDVTVEFEGLLTAPSSARDEIPSIVSSRIGLRLHILEIDTSNEGGRADSRPVSDAKPAVDPTQTVRLKRVTAKDLELSLFADQSVFDVWQKAVNKEDLRKDCISPTHSWTEPPLSKGTRSESSFRAAPHTDVPGDRESENPQKATLEDHQQRVAMPKSFEAPREQHKPKATNPFTDEIANGSDVSNTERRIDSSETSEEISSLAESRMFSSGEAQSLYMSAFDEPNRVTHPTQVHALDHDTAYQPARTADWHQSRTWPSLGEAVDTELANPQLSSANASSGCDVNGTELPRQSQASQLARQLFSCDEITLEMPMPPENDVAPGPFGEPFESGPQYSTHHPMPGSFSESLSGADQYQPTSQPQALQTNSRKSLGAINLVAGNFDVQADLPSCAMLHRMLQSLRPLLRGDHSHANTSSPNVGGASDPERRWSLEYVIRRIQVRLDNLWSLEDFENTKEPYRHGEVAKAEAMSIRGHVGSGAGFDDQLMALGQLQIRVAGLDAVHFSKLNELSRSTFRHQGPVDDAVVLQVKHTANSVEINVTTSVLHCHFDLSELDERLATFGGVSGLMEVGSLVMSEDASSASTSPVQSSRKQRSVKFDIGPEHSVTSSGKQVDASTPKLNVRVGSVEGQLKTQAGTLSFTTSAVKFVQRPGIAGIQVDKILVSGPQAPAAVRPSPTVEIQNLGIKLLPRPEEIDLSRLLALLAPSNAKFARDDDLLVDTLIKQRRQGTIVRVSVGRVSVLIHDLGDIDTLRLYVEGITRLSNLSQYLPKESRPGALTVGSVQEVEARLTNLPGAGDITLAIFDSEVAHVGSPLVFAFSCRDSSASCSSGPPILHSLVHSPTKSREHMIMIRIIGDELDPALRIKLSNLCAEYNPGIFGRLQTAFSANRVSEPGPGGASRPMDAAQEATRPGSPRDDPRSSSSVKSLRLEIQFKDCGFGLSSADHLPRGLFVVSDASFRGPTSLPSGGTFDVEVRKGTFWLTNDCIFFDKVKGADEANPHPSMRPETVDKLSDYGYVTVSWISSAQASVGIQSGSPAVSSIVDAEFQNELIVIETCADSMQTLSQLFSTLKPPPVDIVRDQLQFQTEVAPFEDMMASFSGDAFDLRLQAATQADTSSASLHDSLGDDYDDLAGDPMQTSLSTESLVGFTSERAASESMEMISGGLQPHHMVLPMASDVCRWDSRLNKFDPVTSAEVHTSPLVVRVRRVNVVWNLHDGFDWTSTRERISQAVHDVQAKKMEGKRQQHANSLELDGDDTVIDDFLFNSIYIGIPANKEPQDMAREINMAVDDEPTESGSYASNETQKLGDVKPPHEVKPSKLRLGRSKRQKLAFDLRGLSADIVQFSAGSETEASVSIRIQSFEIFDHVPTSTWRKFVTYQQQAGPREETKPMVQLELCAVRPVPSLTASELVVRATVLPLRLHVDQDALDFMTRFFDFHDESAAPPEGGSSPAGPYLQRVEVRPVQIKLDYKPKKVDYIGLRSGRTKEFMNFFNLDAADIELRHVIVYGCPSFARLHQNLEDIWMPDIKSNQLPYILSGLNGVRTLVNVGDGFRNLLTIPVHEYQKDGRLIRSISKGAESFLRTTGGEITRFGARLATGAQNALQGAERRLSFQQAGEYSAYPNATDISDSSGDDGKVRVHSAFADQPIGFLQGLRGAASSLERDLLATRDVIVAVSGEVRASTSAEDAARAVVRHAPTLVLRPMIGASKAVSQTLMGATNAVDPANMQRMSDKYKRQ